MSTLIPNFDLNKRVRAHCETHDEIFETECPSCAMWKANTLDQDVQETLTAKASDAPQNPDGWVDWNGGESPDDLNSEVEILRRDGEVTSAPAAWFVWEHTGEGDDIVAYKVLTATQTTPSDMQSGGVKFDQGKPPVSLVDRHAIEQIANVLAFGAKKYAAHNWRQGINYSRLLDAALRHLFAFADGEDNDPESGLSHIAHAGCCVVFLLGMINTRPDLDDRFKATK